MGAFTITEINYLVVSLFCDVVLPSDGIQNFKNRFSFVSNSLTTGSLILENHLLRSSKVYNKKQERVR